ncbi:hypothetical protein EV188_10419 [Actinomycetospora succinea]|uniref:4-amino-4-deoxy-L-arabinose transferase-like glycosyltransferase n=1 Tax=Actinomycetospora succinea TaxID=663603 RepID=A0A4R6VD41_9PSEU|nr:hypothetical protein [Actinomycetospora succinea]TDQ58280.1 hypothetical protein EV188_10419 [Actinomycetospora succinea]
MRARVEQARAPTRGRGAVATSVITAAVAAVPVVVVLLPAQLVVMDGGLHLSSSVALRGMLGGQWPDLLVWRPGLPPNLLVELLLGATSGVLDADVVVRGAVVLALVGFAVAAVVVVHAAGAPTWTALLLLPVQMSASLLVGLLGFVIAIVPALFAVALALRRAADPPAAGLAALLALSWLTHLVPTLAATIAVVAVVFCAAAAEHPVGRALVLTVRRLAVPLGVLAVLLVAFAASGGTGSNQAVGLFDRGGDVLAMRTPLVALAHPEYRLAAVLALTLYGATAVLVVVRVRSRRRVVAADGLLVAAVVLGLAAAAAPDRFGTASYIGGRLSLFLPLFLGAWIGAQWSGPRLTRGVVATAAVLAAVVAVALPVARAGPLLSLGRDLAEVRTLAPCAPAGATIADLSVAGGDDRATRMTPLIDLSGYLAADRDLLDLRNAAGSVDYYVWTLTPAARPVPRLVASDADLDEVPPPVTLGAAVAAGYPLETVLVTGRRDAEAAVLDGPDWRRTEADLQASYRRVAVTATGYGELWVRKDRPSPCG